MRITKTTVTLNLVSYMTQLDSRLGSIVQAQLLNGLSYGIALSFDFFVSRRSLNEGTVCILMDIVQIHGLYIT